MSDCLMWDLQIVLLRIIIVNSLAVLHCMTGGGSIICYVPRLFLYVLQVGYDVMAKNQNTFAERLG